MKSGVSTRHDQASKRCITGGLPDGSAATGMTEGAGILNVARATPLVFAIMRCPETLLVLSFTGQAIRESLRKKPTKRCSKDAI